MKLLFLLISTFGYLGYFSRLPGVGPYRAPFIFCCFVTLALYSAAIIGQLPIGLWVVVALGSGLALFKGVRWFYDGAKCSVRSLVIALLFVLPFVWYYRVIDTRFNFLLWDEFTFWASSAKIIYETNALFQADSPIFLKSYPPAQQIFQYYITKLAGWSEKNVLYAQGIWILSGLLCIAGSFSTRSSNIGITFLLSSVMLYYLDYSLSSIYSDALLGVCFAASVCFAQSPNRPRSATAALLLSLAVLILIKEIAIALALIAWVVYLVVALLGRTTVMTQPKSSMYSTLGQGVVYLLVVISVQRSWAWYVSTLQGSRQSTGAILEQLSAAVETGRAEQTWSEFLIRITKTGYLKLSSETYFASPAIWTTALLLLLLMVAGVILSPQATRRRLAAVSTILCAGGVAYLGVLLLSFLVFFTEYEGVRLASFERYLSTYTLALALVSFAIFMATFDARSPWVCRINQIVVSLVLLVIAPATFYADLWRIEGVGTALTIRRDTEAFAAQVKRHIKNGQSVYFVAQNSNGLERGMFYYAMLPYSTHTGWCWSFGKKYYDGDVWTCDKNIAELVQGHDYLALYHADQQFWDVAGSLFDPSARNLSHGIFRINRGAVTGPLFTEIK